jgi:glycerol-3-phosphate dehydrogenase
MNDTRMCLHVALTATQKGACIASRVSVESLTHDAETGKLNGAVVKDLLTGETFPIRTRAIVNAAGAFIDSIRKMDNPDVEPCIKGAAGGMYICCLQLRVFCQS